MRLFARATDTVPPDEKPAQATETPSQARLRNTHLELDAAWASMETAAGHLSYAYRHAALLLLDPSHAEAVRAFNKAHQALRALLDELEA